MEIRYGGEDLRRLAVDPAYEGGHSPAIVKVYRKRVQLIQNAADERDFYALKSLHYEKLKGARANQRSMRLNEKWRLVLEITDGATGKYVHIVAIEDYH